MKIHRRCKIEEVASTEKDTRSGISEPYLDIENGVGTMVATDGRMLVAVPVEIDPADVPGHVSGATLKATRLAQRREEFPDVRCYTVTPERRGSAGGYPFAMSWRGVVPEKNRADTVSVVIDTTRLHKIAQAMGTCSVVLQFVPNSTTQMPALALPTVGGGVVPAYEDAYGVLMLAGVDVVHRVPASIFAPVQKLKPPGVRMLIV